MLHRVKLTNGQYLLVEERSGQLHIASESPTMKGEVEYYICTISPDGVLVMPNSGDATTTVTQNLVDLVEWWITRTPVQNVPAGTRVRLIDGEADGDPEYALVEAGDTQFKIHWDELERPEDYANEA